MKRLDQKIYALRLSDQEAKDLVSLLNGGDTFTSALARVRRRLERIMDQIGDDE